MGFIHSLVSLGNKEFYLLLIDDGQAEAKQVNKRCSDWYRLATQAGLSLDNIVRLHAAGADE